MLHQSVCSLVLSGLFAATSAAAEPDEADEMPPSGTPPMEPAVVPTPIVQSPQSQPSPSQPSAQSVPPTASAQPYPPPYTPQPYPQANPAMRSAAPAQPGAYNQDSSSSAGATYYSGPPSGDGGRTYGQPPPQPEPAEPVEPKKAFDWPTMSVRIDPLNWLLDGRLGLELESQVWKFISVELIPTFIVNDQPPYLNLNLSGVPNTLHQKSGGVGALAGTAVGVGFWLNGKPMEGYVLRAELTDYVIDYEARDEGGVFDRVEYKERAFEVLIGSHSKWGPVTLAGTFGLGSMLNHQNRCIRDFAWATSGCTNNKELSLAISRNGERTGDVVNLHDWSYPIVVVVRISLGVVF